MNDAKPGQRSRLQFSRPEIKFCEMHEKIKKS